MIQKFCSTVLVMAMITAAAGCSSQKEAQLVKKPSEPVEQASGDQKSVALQHFIDGSLFESKNQFAEAIIEFQDALRYNKDPAIYYALAKDYSALNKPALAAEMAAEAVRLDSANLTYRETLADIYIKAFQVDSAIAEYRSILKIDSTHVQSMFNIAQLLAPKYPLQALEMYDKILQRDGPEWEVLFKVAELNSTLRRYDKAAAAIEQMVKIDPSNMSLKQNLGEMYVRSAQYDKALALFNDMLESDPRNVELRGAVAEVYLQQDKWAKAHEQFELILKNDSLSADVRFRIAIAYLEQSQKDSTLLTNAKAQFISFLSRYPDDWRPMFYLGRLAILEKNDSAAFQYFDKVTKVAGWNAEAWWYLGSILFDKKDFSQAVSVLEKARQIIPNDGGINFLLGYGYTRVDRNEDAIAPLQRAIEINPKDINALSSLASTYDALKRYSEADKTFEAALKVDSLNPMVLNNYAYSLSERGEQLERAFAMSKASLARDSANGSYLDTFGWIYFKLGNYAQAEKYVKQAIDAGEASAVVYEHLGDIYSKMSQLDKAKEVLGESAGARCKERSTERKAGARVIMKRVLIFLSLIALSGCAPTKELRRPAATQSAQQVIDAVNSRRYEVATLKAKGSISVESPSFSSSGSFELRLRRPDSVLVVIEGPFGIHVASVLFAKGHYTFYNSFKNEVMEGEVNGSTMPAFMNIQLAADDVIDTFCGTRAFMRDETSPDSFTVREGSYVLLFRGKSGATEYRVDTQSLLVTGVVHIDSAGEVWSEEQFEYDRRADGTPALQTIRLSQEKMQTSLSLSYDDLQLNGPVDPLELQVPSDARRITKK